MISQQSDALAIDGLINLRDLGGLPTACGQGTTRPGRFLRSESPHTLGAELGLRELPRCRHRRSRSTCARRQSVSSDRARSPRPGSTRLHAPIFTDDEGTTPTISPPPPRCTAGGSESAATGGAAAMSAIADAPSARILVHCHAGKDRTGCHRRPGAAPRRRGASMTSPTTTRSAAVQLAEMLARDRGRRESSAGWTRCASSGCSRCAARRWCRRWTCVDAEQGGGRCP